MRLTLTAILVLLALAFPRFVAAADIYPITAADQKFLAEVVDAIHKKDVVWLAGHMAYPISVTVSNRTYVVKSQKEFAPILSRGLTDRIRTQIADAAKAPLFKNWQGVMVGDGLLWFSAYQSPGDNSWTYGIFTLGHIAFQPKGFSTNKEGAPSSSPTD
jgi:hypothetical protein